jgi:hypothetical protein
MDILYDSEPLFPSVFMVNTAGSHITEHDDDDGIKDFFDVESNNSNYKKS